MPERPEERLKRAVGAVVARREALAEQAAKIAKDRAGESATEAEVRRRVERVR